MFDSELSIRATGARTWELLAPLIWTGSQGDTFTVPVGFSTDFATVPRVLRSVVEPYGGYTRAAVLHDYLLSLVADVEGRAAWRAGQPSPYAYGSQPITSQDADAIFRKVMHELGIGYAKRWSMWAAVRWGALFNADRAYGRRFAADLPRILPISLLAVPFLAPATLGNIISLTLARLVTWVTPPVRLPRRDRPGRASSKGPKP